MNIKVRFTHQDKRLLEKRLDGKSQNELAENLGVHLVTIQRRERDILERLSIRLSMPLSRTRRLYTMLLNDEKKRRSFNPDDEIEMKFILKEIRGRR